MSLFNKMFGEEGTCRAQPRDCFGEIALIDNFPRSAHAITKNDLDKILIMDRELRYKLLWVFTKTLSKRLAGQMKRWRACRPAISGRFNVFSIVRERVEWYTTEVTALI